MPRATKSRRAQSPAKEELTVSTATATAATVESEIKGFEINIRPAAEDEIPVRSPAGRKRVPSPFEDESKPYYLPNLKGAGWQNQPHDGNVTPVAVGEDGTPRYDKNESVKDSNALYIIRELYKAVRYFNSPEGGELNLGLGLNVTKEYVQFNIRDKQARKTKGAEGSDDSVEDDEFDVDVDADSGDE